jgi:hypothetical protein
MQDNEQAPPVIDSSVVRAFAIARSDVSFTGKQCIFVDGVKVGAASRVAVAFNERCNDYLLLLCDELWQSFAVAGFPTVDEAIETAERWYAGISSHWVRTDFSPEQDRRHLEEYFDGEMCSFCAALPNQVKSMFEGNGAWICDKCVIEFSGSLGDKDDN